MEAEVVRDSLLHLAGKLDLTTGGPSIDPTPAARRRALYFKQSRDHKNLLLTTFDAPDILACYRRSESIVPQQALALTNSKLAHEMAAAITTSIQTPDNPEFTRQVFQKILARSPDDNELQECLTFLKNSPNRTHLTHALLNHNDFVTVR